MRFPTHFRPAFLAGLCAAGLVAAPEDHRATVVNRTRHKWELRLSDQGHGTLQVTVQPKKGKPTTLEYGPAEAWLIILRPQDEATLSFLESKGLRTRPATLGVIGALEETRSALYFQDGPSGMVLAATSDGPFKQKGNRLVIQDPDEAGPSCAIL
jgi:hypothetical protein